MSKTNLIADHMFRFRECRFGPPPSFQISGNKTCPAIGKCILCLRLHGRTHIRGLASSKSIMPLKANIFPVWQLHNLFVFSEMGLWLKKKKKIYCNPYCPLPTIALFIRPLIASENCTRACVRDKRQRQSASVGGRKRGKWRKGEKREENNGKETERKRYGQKAVVCSHHSSPRTLFYKTNEPWLL